jgi:hypothetical protein
LFGDGSDLPGGGDVVVVLELDDRGLGQVQLDAGGGQGGAVVVE